MKIILCVDVFAGSVMSDSATPRTVALSGSAVWNFLGKNTGGGCHFLLQGLFPIQGSNPDLLHLLHRQVDSLPVYHLGSPLCVDIAQ